MVRAGIDRAEINGGTNRAAIWDGVWGGSIESLLDGHPHWRHLTNTVEQMCAAAMSGSATSGVW